jgi:hypothetical protein
MRKGRSLCLVLSVCAAVSVLVASPARAEDAPPPQLDPTAIVAAISADGTPIAVPQLPAVPEVPGLPAVPETPVIPANQAPIPSAVLPPMPTDPPVALPVVEATPPPDPSPAPAAAEPASSTPVAPQSPVSNSTPPTADTGNITADNLNGITAIRSSNALRTFVWNWSWNCDMGEAVAAVPQPPPDATAIVLNWHWSCAEAPPPISVAGITLCASCNIAISVRIGSPGDTGNLAQSIASSAATTVASVAETIQSALQEAAPAREPSTPPATAAQAAVSAVLDVQPLVYLIDAGPAALPVDDPSTDMLAPRGAPSAFSGPAPLQTGRAVVRGAAHAWGLSAGSIGSLATSATTEVRTAEIERWSSQRSSAASRAERPRAPAPARVPAPPAPAPPAPTPFVLTTSAAGTHGGGSDAFTALAMALTIIFAYAAFAAVRFLSAVPPARAAAAKPHPPG